MIRRERDEAPLIRRGTAADLDDIMEIELASFHSPWARGVFLEELTRRWARLKVLCATPRSNPSAFVNYWVVRDEVHLLNLATRPEHRRRGYASLLISDMLEEARAGKGRYVTLEVRRSNEAAQALYLGFGFRSIGIRPRYYAENQEDAIVMLLTLPGHGR